MHGHYEEPRPISRDQYERMRDEATDKDLCAALVALTFYEPSLAYVRNECLSLIRGASPDVRIVAATCLGHLARIHGRLDSDEVLPALRTLLDDPRTRGAAENALDDIAMFAAEG